MVRRLPGYEPVRHSTEDPVSSSATRFPEFETEPMMESGRSSYEVISQSRAPSPTLSTLAAEFDPYAASPWQEKSPSRSRASSFSEANHGLSATPAGTSPRPSAGPASTPAAESDRPSHRGSSPTQHGTQSPEPLLNHPPEHAPAYTSDERPPHYEETTRREDNGAKGLTIAIVGGLSFYTALQIYTSKIGLIPLTVQLWATFSSTSVLLYIDAMIHAVWIQQPKAAKALRAAVIVLCFSVAWNAVISQYGYLELSQGKIEKLQQKVASLEDAAASASVVATATPTLKPAPYVAPNTMSGAHANATRPEHAFGLNHSIVVDPDLEVSHRRKLAFSAKFRY